jgi:hypothetical protein
MAFESHARQVVRFRTMDRVIRRKSMHDCSIRVSMSAWNWRQCSLHSRTHCALQSSRSCWYESEGFCRERKMSDSPPSNQTPYHPPQPKRRVLTIHPGKSLSRIHIELIQRQSCADKLQRFYRNEPSHTQRRAIAKRLQTRLLLHSRRARLLAQSSRSSTGSDCSFPPTPCS